MPLNLTDERLEAIYRRAIDPPTYADAPTAADVRALVDEVRRLRPLATPEGRALRRVSFYHDGDEVGLIVCLPTDVVYSTQAAGIACRHPSAVGVYVPLSPCPEFPHAGCWGAEISDADWRDVKAALEKGGYPVQLDDSRRKDAMEAWWPVIVVEGPPQAIDLSDFIGMQAWLVTANCD